VLRLLAFTRTGTLPIGRVGERLQVHPASVTNAVRRLERDGLAERRDNPDDGRSVLVSITEEGRALTERCTKLLNDEVFALVPLSRDRLVDGFALLREVRRDLGDVV
jgi:DNA-binding MarR family transcriptional regulator